EPVPCTDVAIARVDERVARGFAVDDHPTAHPEVERKANAGVDVEHDELAATARLEELRARQRGAHRRRGQAPLQEPCIGCLDRRDPAVECARFDERARCFDFEDLRHSARRQSFVTPAPWRAELAVARMRDSTRLVTTGASGWTPP